MFEIILSLWFVGYCIVCGFMLVIYKDESFWKSVFISVGYGLLSWVMVGRIIAITMEILLEIEDLKAKWRI